MLKDNSKTLNWTDGVTFAGSCVLRKPRMPDFDRIYPIANGYNKMIFVVQTSLLSHFVNNLSVVGTSFQLLGSFGIPDRLTQDNALIIIKFHRLSQHIPVNHVTNHRTQTGRSAKQVHILADETGMCIGIHKCFIA